MKAETIKTRKPKSHRNCDKTGRKLFISIREGTGEGGKDRENAPKGKDTERKICRVEESDIKRGRWRVKEGWRKTPTAEQTNYTSLLMQTASFLMPHAVPFSPTQG